ncbi:MAG: SDR family NAD(P)-dependent oxidoreductase [Candidatus Dormibacter sp.]|uniref:SDR family NAD(P)-dependent oxidoreductase n=1 Tax=Candidatus Dormibacter sp. TaxID=2973982 RepID=UPI003D9BD346
MAEAATEMVPTYPDLAGKVAVVTGGSKGIGSATCRVLAANGVRVAVVGRDQAAIAQVVQSITSETAPAIGVSADMVSYEDTERMRQQVEAELGPADILVPFAGGFGRHTPIQNITEEEWRFVIDSNLTSTFFTCKSFLPGMMERRRGSIITMASNAARILDIPLTASYAAAKAGIVMFTRHVAKEVGPHGVRVNCVAPATTMSERVERLLTTERIQELTELAPLKRFGQPQDTALATLFLASEASSWITGITIDVAGGRVML